MGFIMKYIKTFSVTLLVAFSTTSNISFAGCDPACKSGETCGYNSTKNIFVCRATKAFQLPGGAIDLINPRKPKGIEKDSRMELEKQLRDADKKLKNIERKKSSHQSKDMMSGTLTGTNI